MSEEVTNLLTGAKATLDQIVAIDRKIDGLREKKVGAEEAFLHRTRVLYAEGGFTVSDLLDLADTWIPCFFEPEWEERWAAAGLPKVEFLRMLWADGIKYTANGPHGSWTNYPDKREAPPGFVRHTASDENPMPPRGQNVVYILYDGSSTPCYVGSTGDFSKRLKWHLKDGKPVVVWVAYPCESREAAYALEDRLLKQHMPYLNKKRGA